MRTDRTKYHYFILMSRINMFNFARNYVIFFTLPYSDSKIIRTCDDLFLQRKVNHVVNWLKMRCQLKCLSLRVDEK